MDYPVDLSKAEDFLLNTLPVAGQILRQYFHAKELVKKHKGKIDIVTSADLAVDDFFHKKIGKAYPGVPILTEETAPDDFLAQASEQLLWVVDPLDGTANFARGDSNYSISVALVSYGQPLVGALFVPVHSRLFWARADGNAAYWNGRRIHVSPISTLEEAVVCTDWSHILETRDATTSFLRKIFGTVRQIKILGSAATDISLLAWGGVDIYHHVHLMPWDVAASALIADKAGAIVTDTKGGKWNVFTADMLAANAVLHKKILKIIT